MQGAGRVNTQFHVNQRLLRNISCIRQQVLTKNLIISKCLSLSGQCLLHRCIPMVTDLKVSMQLSSLFV